jgi:hypothetical protein
VVVLMVLDTRMNVLLSNSQILKCQVWRSGREIWLSPFSKVDGILY